MSSDSALQELTPPATTAVACSAAKKLAAWVGKAGGMPPVALIAAVSAVLRSYNAAVAKLEALPPNQLLSRETRDDDTVPSGNSDDGTSNTDSDSDSDSSSTDGSGPPRSPSSSGDLAAHARLAADREQRVRLEVGCAVRLAHVQALDRLFTLLHRQGTCAPPTLLSCCLELTTCGLA